MSNKRSTLQSKPSEHASRKVSKAKRVLRVLFTIVCLLLVFALVCTALSFSNASKAEIKPEQDLLENAVVSVTNGEVSGDGFTGTAGTAYTAELSAPAVLNTVVLREDGANCRGFSIEALVDGAYTQIYAQDDKIGEYRYCAFPEVETTALRITVQGADAPFTIEDVEAFSSERKAAEDFRVTTYITAATAYDLEGLRTQAGSFDVITDVILFGAVRFAADGTLYYPDLDLGDGTTADGETVFRTALQNLREVIGDRDVRIHCNFIGPDAPEGTAAENAANAKCDQHNLAFGDNRDTLIAALLEFTAANDFDGIYFDYEYPRRLKDWFTFSRFLSALKEEINGQYQLGAAVPVWKNLWEIFLSRSVDTVEVMGYDAFDAEDGHHASFARTASGVIGDYLSLGYSADKMDLGMPFFSRPIDGGEYWYTYSGDARQLGKYQNVAEGLLQGCPETEEENTPDRYYNGWQMVYDKTAYAIDVGLGGVMVWHYGCDLPYEDELSLFGAMAQAIEDRTVQA